MPRDKPNTAAPFGTTLRMTRRIDTARVEGREKSIEGNRGWTSLFKSSWAQYYLNLGKLVGFHIRCSIRKIVSLSSFIPHPYSFNPSNDALDHIQNSVTRVQSIIPRAHNRRILAVGPSAVFL